MASLGRHDCARRCERCSRYMEIVRTWVSVARASAPFIAASPWAHLGHASARGARVWRAAQLVSLMGNMALIYLPRLSDDPHSAMRFCGARSRKPQSCIVAMGAAPAFGDAGSAESEMRVFARAVGF